MTKRKPQSNQPNAKMQTKPANDKQPSRRAALKSGIGLAAAAASVAAPKKVAADGPLRKLGSVAERTQTSHTPLKQRAIDDYRNSLSQYGGQLASPIRELFLTAEKKDCVHFGVVVIGSGYGASITAARISQRLRPEHRMCILERGKEWIPGTFPDTFPKVSGNARSTLTGPTKGQQTQPLGLFNLMMNDEVNILSGNGLGGGSLINASIALRPHKEVFEQQRWPMALKTEKSCRHITTKWRKALAFRELPATKLQKSAYVVRRPLG